MSSYAKNREFHTDPVSVEVPASSANLGPGFDTFGLALSIFDRGTAQVCAEGLTVLPRGEGADQVPRDHRHLVVQAMRAAFDQMNVPMPGLVVGCEGRIPHARGLGSSAAAIVMGIELARGLVVNGPQRLTDADALSLASRMEGHPDNASAAMLGGLTLAWMTGRHANVVRLELSGIQPVVFIPVEHSATSKARAALPPMVPHRDAAFNATRSALLVLALTERPDLLLEATSDRLHQDYRAPDMPASAGLVTALRNRGVAAAISGAGSSVLALIRHTGEREIAS